MKIIVATRNKRKLSAVRSVLQKMDIGENFDIFARSVSSGVPDTPFGKETKQGAINRAKNAQLQDPACDMYIGMESGLVNRYGDMFEEVWVAVIKGERQFVAYSSGVRLPFCVSNQLTEFNVTDHPNIMNVLRKQKGINVCQNLGVDTWGDYTGGKIKREVGLEEALRNAFAQVFCGKDSWYDIN